MSHLEFSMFGKPDDFRKIPQSKILKMRHFGWFSNIVVGRLFGQQHSSNSRKILVSEAFGIQLLLGFYYQKIIFDATLSAAGFVSAVRQ